MSKTFIKEIFSSIQGEGTHLGEMQIFVRFCKCNLSCKYCDTEFLAKNNTKEYTAKELAENLLHNEVQTVSLTGGEPLLDVIFLKEFLPLIKKQKNIYLETNGTLPNELSAVINYVDIIAADIKLESATKQKNKFNINDEFLNIAKEKECFVKVVFDENIEKAEINEVIKIVAKHDLPLILQPKMIRNDFCSNPEHLVEIYKIFYTLYPQTRLIPQMHKFLKVQ